MIYYISPIIARCRGQIVTMATSDGVDVSDVGDDEKRLCGVCLGPLSDPRSLPCKHVYCKVGYTCTYTHYIHVNGIYNNFIV